MKLLLAAFLIIFSFTAGAQSIGDSVRSIRSRGMGGVYIPFASGAESIFFNPAGLGKSKLLDIQLLDVGLGVNANAISQMNNIQKADPKNPSTLTPLFGQRIWAEGTGKTAVSLPFLSVGYIHDTEVSLQLNNPTYPQFDTYFRNDQAFYVGEAFTIAPSTYLGVTLKRDTRWGGAQQNIAVSSIAGSSSMDTIGGNFQNKGVGYGMDLGVMTELPAPLVKPTFAVVWQDVGSTAFTKTAGTDAPPRILQNLSAGAGLSMDLAIIDWSAGIEARHLLEPNIEIGKKLYVGTELSLPLIDIRAGYSQGYMSYGVGLNFLIFHFDAASYTEETGIYPGQAGDVRYMASLSIDLSFDASFKFTDNEGKRRKLKQRR
ncbi:MAG: hypothetical protein ACXVCY_02030 [Pseudobdellovibrionaceae bacterium]